MDARIPDAAYNVAIVFRLGVPVHRRRDSFLLHWLATRSGVGVAIYVLDVVPFRMASLHGGQ
jgi:hypothetical protein